jgi:hypothetical protein
LKNQPLQLTNNSVAYSPVLESIILQPGDYFGIKVAENLKASELLFDLKSGNVKKWGVMESSSDGENWKALDWTEKNGKGKIELNSSDVKFIRFINTSKEKQTAFLKEFKVMVEAGNQAGQQGYALDGSIQTFETFSNQSILRVDLPGNFKNKSLTFLIDKEKNSGVIISAVNAKGKATSLYQGKENYIVLDKKKLKDATSIVLSLDTEDGAKVYEIIPGM